MAIPVRLQSRLRRSLALLLLVTPALLHAQIYAGRATSQDAPVVLSNFRSESTPRLLIGTEESARGANAPGARDVSRPARGKERAPREIAAIVDAVARSVGISSDLIFSVMAAESNYDPHAVSRKGAIGLMQLMPATARRFGVQDPTDVRANVHAGASYLRWLMDYFDGDLDLALAGYNAGEGAVVNAGRAIPDYPETRAYVARIRHDLRQRGAQQ